MKSMSQLLTKIPKFLSMETKTRPFNFQTSLTVIWKITKDQVKTWSTKHFVQKSNQITRACQAISQLRSTQIIANWPHRLFKWIAIRCSGKSSEMHDFIFSSILQRSKQLKNRNQEWRFSEWCFKTHLMNSKHRLTQSFPMQSLLNEKSRRFFRFGQAKILMRMSL